MGKGLPVSDSHTAMNNCYTLCLIKHFDIFFIMILSIYSFFFFFYSQQHLRYFPLSLIYSGRLSS